MKLRLPYLLRNAVLAALLCCTMAFGTVTVTVDGQNSSLEQLAGTPSGSVSITVEGEDVTLSQPVTLDGSVDHYITVEEGHSLTIMGGLTYEGLWDWMDEETGWGDYEKHLNLSCDTIVFASGNSRLMGLTSNGVNSLVVQKGAKLTTDSYFSTASLTIEEGGELISARYGAIFAALNGNGTLRFVEDEGPENDRYIGIDGDRDEPANFAGNVEGEGLLEVVGGGRDDVSKHQRFTNVMAKGTDLASTNGGIYLSGLKNVFRSITIGDAYNGVEFDEYSPGMRDLFTIGSDCKVVLGKSLAQAADDPFSKENPQIDEPVVQRGLSFRMEHRAKLVIMYGKSETGAKITASGAINLSTTMWEGHDPTRLTVRVEFAENPGRDFKQLLIQANGIVLSSMKYDLKEQFKKEFTLLEQYTDEDSEELLNKWLRENVGVEVDGYEDPYLMVEKEGESLVQLYVAAGDVADLPDDPEPDKPGTDTPGTDTPGTDTPGTDTPGTDTPGTSNPDTIFAPLVTSENSRAGAGMLYHAMNHSTSSELQNVVGVIAELAQIGQGGQPAVAMAAMIAEPGTAEMLIKETAIDPVVAKSEAQRLMSAVVGSAVPALGAAQRDAMRGQLSRAASRAARLGQAPAAHGDSGQGMRVWMEGIGGRAKLDRSGDETGYEHDSWGASIGVEKAFQDGDTTVGLSLVASYGDLKVDAVDYARGDLDTYYVNLYAHQRSGNFHHSFVVSAGFSDAEFNRTIRGGVAPYVLDYATNGSTNGTGFGAAYELAYDISLDEQKSSLLQPMIGLSLVTTKMDGYNEGGAGDVGLHVGEQESTLTTLTAGARFVSQCGEQAFSRAAVLSLRANVAVDMGDRRSEADVSFLGDRSYGGCVRSAETGVVGAQLGASVSVPVDSNTVLYMNGEADLRSGSSSWNVGAGVSVAF